MNDHDAMTAINKVLERYFKSEITTNEAMNKLCFISGQNAPSTTKSPNHDRG